MYRILCIYVSALNYFFKATGCVVRVLFFDIAFRHKCIIEFLPRGPSPALKFGCVLFLHTTPGPDRLSRVHHEILTPKSVHYRGVPEKNRAHATVGPRDVPVLTL